jgi:hypothetical protein
MPNQSIDQIYRSVNWLLARAADLIKGTERTPIIRAALSAYTALSKWEESNGPICVEPSHPLPRCNFCASPRTNARRFGFTLVTTGPMRGLICDACLESMRLERRLFYRTF